MTTFVLATANPHKAAEMTAILGALGIAVQPRPENVPDVPETSATLEGNALLKARALAAATGQCAVADDTGLFVDALAGLPGVHSARYAGPDATDHENVQKLLGEMGDVPDHQRTAYFRTVIAVARPNGESFSVEGHLDGTIIRTPRGRGGFGYDPVFAVLEAQGRTLGELTVSEKNRLSHRARALRALAEKLKDQ